MRNLAFLAVLAISTMALAGCSGDGGEGDGDTTSSSSSSSSRSSSSSTSRSSSSSTSASSSTSGGPGPNGAPTGSISASVDGTNATFDLDGSDPDGDIIVWDLTFGDGSGTNGTTLPATITHAYAAAGNFSANFTITDGTDPTTYTVAVGVAGGQSGGPLVIAMGVISYCISCEPPFVGTFPGACIGWQAGENNQDCGWAELEVASVAGKPFTATTSDGDVDLAFLGSCEADPQAEGEVFNAVGPESGDVPADAGCVLAWLYFEPPAGAQGATITITIG